jgi:formamidopyrimidine-DNA glycosylase
VPELPEVEAVRRLLAPAMERARFVRVVVNRPDLRIPFPENFARRLRGVTVKALARRGKYLLAYLSSDEELIMHLGMSGWFYVEPTGKRTRKRDAHDHVIFVMSSGKTVTYNDPRRFGLMDLAASDDYKGFMSMGPEPRSPSFNPAICAAGLRWRKVPIKVALLDQKVVAGLGNIYASEALHRARVSPLRSAASLVAGTGKPLDAAKRLVAAIKSVLTDAIRRSETPYQSGRFRVYDRKGLPCLRKGCTGKIRTVTQAGRSTFYCPVCQR